PRSVGAEAREPFAAAIPARLVPRHRADSPTPEGRAGPGQRPRGGQTDARHFAQPTRTVVPPSRNDGRPRTGRPARPPPTGIRSGGATPARGPAPPPVGPVGWAALRHTALADIAN